MPNIQDPYDPNIMWRKVSKRPTSSGVLSPAQLAMKAAAEQQGVGGYLAQQYAGGGYGDVLGYSPPPQQDAFAWYQAPPSMLPTYGGR